MHPFVRASACVCAYVCVCIYVYVYVWVCGLQLLDTSSISSCRYAKACMISPDKAEMIKIFLTAQMIFFSHKWDELLNPVIPTNPISTMNNTAE